MKFGRPRWLQRSRFNAPRTKTGQGTSNIGSLSSCSRTSTRQILIEIEIENLVPHPRLAQGRAVRESNDSLMWGSDQGSTDLLNCCYHESETNGSPGYMTEQQAERPWSTRLRGLI
jgi:hypothetical protein